MKKTIFILLAFVLAQSLNAQNNLELAKQETAAFLKTLSSGVNASNIGLFHLKSVEEIAFLQADQAFPSYIIPLDLLKKYEGGDVKALITNINRVVCTVINIQTKQTVGTVDLELIKERYVVKGYTGSDISTALGRINKEYFRQNFSLVRVPALNFYFGSFTDNTDNQMKFVSLQNDANLRTEIGETKPAAELLKRIVPMANVYNGLPW
jgi:hypothetical protein